MFFFKVILLKIENLQTTDSKIAINVLKGSKTKTSEDKASGQYVIHNIKQKYHLASQVAKLS
jgi:hypothetical protein